MLQLLAGDIGGTKTILRLVQADGLDLQHCPADEVMLETLHEARYASADFPDLVPMVKDFLAAAEAQGVEVAPQTACFAIAGPVVANTSQLTNLAWSLDGERLAKALDLESVELINDFAAVGYGVLGLGPEDLVTLQTGQADKAAPIAVIGAGTGLGQCFLVPEAEQYRVFSSEGGHVDFSPRSELEFQLLRYLLDKHSIGRVSVERVVSGQGIVSIYQFLRDRNVASDPDCDDSPELESLAAIVRTWEQKAGQRSQLSDPAAAIAKAALENDFLATETMKLFIDAYGTEAGNLALKLLPYGGLYIAGGVAAKNIDFMTSGRFIHAFADKGRISHLIEQIPVHVVMNQQVGLIGAAIRAAQLSK
jgi:glucokinase